MNKLEEFGLVAGDQEIGIPTATGVQMLSLSTWRGILDLPLGWSLHDEKEELHIFRPADTPDIARIQIEVELFEYPICDIEEALKSF